MFKFIKFYSVQKGLKEKEIKKRGKLAKILLIIHFGHFITRGVKKNSRERGQNSNSALLPPNLTCEYDL